jgi:hypothetical protein
MKQWGLWLTTVYDKGAPAMASFQHSVMRYIGKSRNQSLKGSPLAL